MSGRGSGYHDGLAVAGLKLISLLFKFNSHAMSASHHGDSNMTDKFELHNKNLLSVPGPGPRRSRHPCLGEAFQCHVPLVSTWLCPCQSTCFVSLLNNIFSLQNSIELNEA